MTTFKNTALNISDLPKIETLEYNKLNKKFLTESLVIRLILILPIAGLVYLFDKKQPDLLLEVSAIAFVILLILIVFGYLSYFKKAYALREKDVSYKRGIIFHSITTIPLSRIQHSELVRGPLDRFFNLSSVKIYTAGGSSSDITIPGLAVETAEQIREFINNKVAADDN